jgi:pilus assembly protein CpaE
VTILCEPDERAVAALVPALGSDVRAVGSLPDAALALVADPAERLVVIGSDVPMEQVIAFAGRLRSERPQGAVVLLRRSLDPDTLAGAAEAGIADVVPSDEPDLVSAACERAGLDLNAEAAATEHDGQHGQVITVFSAKGGTGKTTVATNLAVVLNREGTQRVCLIDLDVEFGDVAISMNLTPARTLIDAVEGHFATDDARGDALLTPFRPGLDCILAPVEPGDSEKVPAGLVTDLLWRLRQRYDYVVIDTPSQFSELVLAALDASDHHVLLTTPEIPSLKNLRLTLDMLDLLHYPRDGRAIVLNRSDADVGLSAADVEAAIKAAVTAHVASSRDVPMSINRGVPLAATDPDHPVSRALHRLATDAITHEPVKTARRRFGLSGRKSRMQSR